MHATQCYLKMAITLKVYYVNSSSLIHNLAADPEDIRNRSSVGQTTPEVYSAIQLVQDEPVLTLTSFSCSQYVSLNSPTI